MRESLFEKNKRKELSFIDELFKIYSLIEHSLEAKYFFIEVFKTSSFSTFWCDFDSALLNIIEIPNNEYFDYVQGFKETLSLIKNNHFEISLNSFLDYLEFFKTLDFDGTSRVKNSTVRQIYRIIEFDCDKLGYTFQYNNKSKVFVVRLKHVEAEAIAISVKENTRNYIYKYLTLRKGETENKRNCLKSLADDLELPLKQNSSIKEFAKLKQFIQCVRHTKDDPVVAFPFYYKNEEEWLDKTFEMMIGFMSFLKTKSIVKEIIDLESTKKGTTQNE